MHWGLNKGLIESNYIPFLNVRFENMNLNLLQKNQHFYIFETIFNHYDYL